jgi:hypothetical protein
VKHVNWGLRYRRLAIGSEEQPSFFDCEGPNVESKDMRGALTIADWYINETLRLEGAGRIGRHLLRAAGRLDWLKAQPGGKAAFREILRFGPNATRIKAAAEVSHGWIAEASNRPMASRSSSRSCWMAFKWKLHLFVSLFARLASVLRPTDCGSPHTGLE